jgi:hypothetical protein
VLARRLAAFRHRLRQLDHLTWLEQELLRQRVDRGLAELRRRNAADPDPDLRTAELRIYSQNGEDGIIDAILRCLPDHVPFFVEFGVGDGAECNTRALVEFGGWSGVYFEPDAASFDGLRSRYDGMARVRCVQAAVQPSNVNERFDGAEVPASFGVLSIDIDGQDLWVWEALDDRFQPDVVVMECNASQRDGFVEQRGLPWSQAFSDSLGASIGAIRTLADRKGYDLVHVDASGVNAFLVRRGRAAAPLVGITDRVPNYHLAGGRLPPLPVRPVVRYEG